MATLSVGPNSTYPTIAAAMAAANSGDLIVLEAGYSNETAQVTVNNITVSGSASSTDVALQLANGIPAITLQGTAPILVMEISANTITGNARPDGMRSRPATSTTMASPISRGRTRPPDWLQPGP